MQWLIPAAYAQDASGATSTSQLLSYAPIGAVALLFYFMIFRPQQQQQKALKATLAAIKRGDRVLTAGGIVGTVQKVKEGSAEIEVEIAPNVRVIVARDTILNVLKPQVPAAANDAKP